jgi:hypothetical protein
MPAFKRAKDVVVGDWIDPQAQQPPVADLENGPSPDDVHDLTLCQIENVEFDKSKHMVHFHMTADANPPLDPDYAGPMIQPANYCIGSYDPNDPVMVWTTEEAKRHEEQLHLNFVRHTLVPDLVRSGKDETANDFRMLLDIIDRRTALLDSQPGTKPSPPDAHLLLDEPFGPSPEDLGPPDSEEEAEELGYQDGTYPA